MPLPSRSPRPDDKRETGWKDIPSPSPPVTAYVVMAAEVRRAEPLATDASLSLKMLLDGGSQDATPRLSEILAWGSCAECVTAVFCPLVMWGALDATATALNVGGAFLAGLAQAVADASADPSVQRVCAGFQAGFITVFTSFSFMTEQAADLAVAGGGGGGGSCSWLAGWLYIVATISAGCAAFAAGRAALGAALRTRLARQPAAWQLPRHSRVPSPPALVRGLLGLIALAWLWVLVSPAGTVFEPLAFERRHDLRRLMPAGAAKAAMAKDRPPAPAQSADKRMDVAHLACGLATQTFGLVMSTRIGVGASRSRAHWGVLCCNLLACAALLGLRGAEAARLGGAGSLLAIKLRTSGCGALSISGGLAVLLCDALGRQSLWERSARGRGRLGVAAVNLLLHVAVASVACALLPSLIARLR